MFTKFDFIYPIGYTFQDEATMTMSQLIVLHDDIMCILLFILGIVFWWLIAAIYEFKINRMQIENSIENIKDQNNFFKKRIFNKSNNELIF